MTLQITTKGCQKCSSWWRREGNFNRREWLWNLISLSFSFAEGTFNSLNTTHTDPSILICTQGGKNSCVIEHLDSSRLQQWKHVAENVEYWVPAMALRLLVQWPWAQCLTLRGPWAHLLRMETRLKHFKGLFNYKILYLFSTRISILWLSTTCSYNFGVTHYFVNKSLSSGIRQAWIPVQALPT